MSRRRKHDIRAAGAQVAFVHGGSAAEADRWFAKYGLAEVARISDPTLAHYRAFGLGPHQPAGAGRSEGLDARRGVRAVAWLRRADAGDDAPAARRIRRARRSHACRVPSPLTRRIGRTTSALVQSAEAVTMR